MDDKSLGGLLNGALTGEPPIGPVAQNSLEAGKRLRRRRRRRAWAAGCAAVAAVAVIIPAGGRVLGHSPGPAGGQRSGTVYVASQSERNLTGRITPISRREISAWVATVSIAIMAVR